MLSSLLLSTFLAAAPSPSVLSPSAAEETRAPAPEATDAAEPTDDPEVAETVDEQSAELEELRALEEVSLTPGANGDLYRAVRRLGMGNPLRHRMRDALELPELSEDETGQLAPITDVAAFDASTVEHKYDIPVEMQPLVAQYIKFFQGPGRRWFRNWMNRSTRYLPVMQPILAERGLPRDTVYLAMIESGFSAHAYSWAHAAGPWQFISSTGKQYGLKQDFWVDERRDPIKSTLAAARYLTDLHREMGHWYLAWAGYNTGGGRVRRVIKKVGSRDFWQLSDGKGFAKETKHYVPKLIAAALVAKHPQAFGFSDSEFEYLPPMEFDEVSLTSATDLEVVARAAGVKLQDLVDLNPELKRWCTPPSTEKKPYLLRLPKGTQETFALNFAKVAPQERLTYQVHRVKRGDTLSGIASKYGSAPEAIMQLNRLRNARALKVNSELAIPVPARASKVAGLERQVAQARRSGFVAHRPEEEVPAGAGNKAVASGPYRTEQVNGRTRVTYTVQSGDSLWAIGQKFNASVEELRRWNNLQARRGLAVGTELELWPEQAPKLAERAGTVIAAKVQPPAAGTSRTHTMASGDTLWSIAQKYSVSVEELKRWNRIANHRTLAAGTRLVVAAPTP